jgi:hypothetical protein
MSERYKIFDDYCCDMFKHNHWRGAKFTWCTPLGTWNINEMSGSYLFPDIKYCPYCGKELVPWHGLIDTQPDEEVT